MARYSLVVQKSAQKQLAIHYKSGDKSLVKRINQIFEELSEHPESGIGNPERLKFELSGFWSRQINKKDRLFYEIEEHIAGKSRLKIPVLIFQSIKKNVTIGENLNALHSELRKAAITSAMHGVKDLSLRSR